MKRTETIAFPTYIFKDRSLAILEALVDYLSDKGYTYQEIGHILNRDSRTIWTVQRRIKQKRHGH